MTHYIIYTLDDRPDLKEATLDFNHRYWPRLMQLNGLVTQYWDRLNEDFPEYQLILLDAETDTIHGLANSLPLHWTKPLRTLPDAGWEWALEQGFLDRQQELNPTHLCLLYITLSQNVRGHSRSTQLLDALKDLGTENGLETMLAPIRPNFKSLHPEVPMEEYIRWTNKAGEAFDPWLRAQMRMGGELIRVCPESMILIGSIQEWEDWTGLKFTKSGPYIVPNALIPIMISQEFNRGVYIEPHVWMKYPMFP